MTRSTIEAVSVVLFGVFSSPLWARTITLKDPDELHAAPTALRRLASVFREKETLYLFGPGLDHYAKMPFKVEGKTRQERYGEYAQVERIKVPPSKYPGEWRGFIKATKSVNDARKTIWDATMLQLLQFFPEKGTVVQEATVPADVLKPARDRMGEPTQAEIKASRETFQKNQRRVFGPKYTGMVRLPEDWVPGAGKDHFLLATKIESFPVTMMSCNSDDEVACTMERFCYLEGGPSVKPKDVAGVGTVTTANKKRYLLVGDAGRHQIQVYQWNSCFDVRHTKTLVLPKFIQKLTSIFTDQEDLLWVTTEKWENKFDSNLYYWELENILK